MTPLQRPRDQAESGDNPNQRSVVTVPRRTKTGDRLFANPHPGLLPRWQRGALMTLCSWRSA